MDENEILLENLAIARTNGGTVTYLFKDGTKQVANINKEVFYSEKTGREKDLNNILNIFKTTCHDIGAISFQI